MQVPVFYCFFSGLVIRFTEVGGSLPVSSMLYKVFQPRSSISVGTWDSQEYILLKSTECFSITSGDYDRIFKADL